MDKVRFTVEFGPRDLEGVLDMLRYDAAVVRDWSHWTTPRGEERWKVTLLAKSPTVDRWRSFGLYPVTQDYEA